MLVFCFPNPESQEEAVLIRSIGLRENFTTQVYLSLYFYLSVQVFKKMTTIDQLRTVRDILASVDAENKMSWPQLQNLQCKTLGYEESIGTFSTM